MKKSNLEALVIELTRKLESLTPATAQKVKTADVIAELIASKTRSNRRAVYLKSLQYYLERFAAKHADLPSVTSDDVENWLAQSKSDYSRQTWLNRISTLFSFAVRRGYIDKNPCDRIDRVTIDRSAPCILTVEQSPTRLSMI